MAPHEHMYSSPYAHAPGSYGWWAGDDSMYDYDHPRDPETYRNRLAPLVNTLAEYDKARRKLEKQGGTLRELEELRDMVTQEITLHGNRSVTLDNPGELARAVREISHYNVRLDIRRLESAMPVYYLSRIREDYFGSYSLVLEDLYKSPGYPMTDGRFARLMERGKERYFLRLSPLRTRTGMKDLVRESHARAKAMKTGGKRPVHRQAKEASHDEAVDRLLYRVGRHVFQSAWHEDQRPGMIAANGFGLTNFRGAVELLYLILSGDLCELRSQVDPVFLGFFKSVYAQPGIHRFLSGLNTMDGGELNELPRQALKQYAALGRAFGRFLNTGVTWGERHMTLPLYKLVFGNLNRMPLLAKTLKNDSRLGDEREKLEQRARQAIKGLPCF